MGEPIIGQSKDGELMHFSVGAVIKDGKGKFLLIDRKNPPYGFAGVAGHVDEGEDYLTAFFREVREESGLRVVMYDRKFREEIVNNTCKRGVSVHYWYLFECFCKGKIRIEKSGAKSIGWYSKEEVRQMAREKKLEPVWEYWFRKLGVI